MSKYNCNYLHKIDFSNNTSQVDYGLNFKGFKILYGGLGMNIYKKSSNVMNMARLRYKYFDGLENKPDNYGTELHETVQLHRIFLNDRNTVKALRFKSNLPCNGQRTQTNAHTARFLRLPQKNKQEEYERYHKKEKKIKFLKRRQFRGHRKKG